MKHGNNVRLIGVTGGVGSGKSAVMDILAKDYGAVIILADLVSHELMEPGQAVYEEVIREFGPGILMEHEPGKSQNEGPGTLAKKEEEAGLPLHEKEILPPIDRKKLGQIVFSDPAKLARLNDISHREVKEEILRRINNYIRDFTSSDTSSAFGFTWKDIQEDSSGNSSSEKDCGEERLLIAVEAALLIGSGLEHDLDRLWYVYVRDEERIRRLAHGRGYSEEYARSIINRQLSDREFRKYCRTVIDNNGDLAETKSQIDQAVCDLFSHTE